MSNNSAKLFGMSADKSDHSPPDFPEAVNLPRAIVIALWVGVGISTAIIFFAAIILIFGDDQTFPGRQNLVILLFLNLVLLGVLAGLVGFRVARRFAGRRYGEPAPRLHLRFIAMFSLAAAAPAILMALFLGGVLTRGVEYWFGERVNTVVESAAETAAVIVEQQSQQALNEIQLMAFDISGAEPVAGFSGDPDTYTAYFRRQAIVRSFPSAYLVDSDGNILVRAEDAGSPDYVRPSGRLYQLARDGDLGVSDPEQATGSEPALRGLLLLPAYEDAFLYVTLDVDLSLLLRAQAALDDFRSATESEAETRLVFILVYLETAFLILLGAIWLALSAATRVVRPVASLVRAAEQVRQGNLDTRVEVHREDDEIATLGRAFNRMTRQLRGQRRELVMAHNQSENRRAFTEAVLSGISAGVIRIDDQDRITLANRPACDLLGRDEDELVGQELAQVSPELESVAIQARQRPGDIASSQIELSEDEERPISLNVRAGLDPDAGLILTFDDVSRLVAAQRSAAWRDVARRIAHEIKNPLTPIQLSAERLQRRYRKQVNEDDVETFDKCVATIVRQVSDIGRMVDEFSSFARMPQPKIEPVSMTDLIRNVVFAQRVASPAVSIDFSHPDTDIYAECDERLAAQALTNIVKNAAESVIARMESIAGTKQKGRIHLTLSASGGYAEITVRDNGLGWPLANRERLTEPYMTTREKGTGLGLAIVKRVMEDHRGRLELDQPEEGHGAIVRMKFPMSGRNGPDIASVTENAQV
ncbi:MAG: PAS domain-containing sensor histidine kinase [Rhodobacterales bacterium CG15_BIG_FIL_POST_REV_8_21_14_020_59_13]|nr:MAG: PAS domain-containing sensor histidine kinase [Rhodobacterales bacterium CG15_BIG_FIL_POST_REV_8_21_14_020_59_13]